MPRSRPAVRPLSSRSIEAAETGRAGPVAVELLGEPPLGRHQLQQLACWLPYGPGPQAFALPQRLVANFADGGSETSAGSEA